MLLQPVEDLAVVIPSAVVAGHEGDSRLHQAPRQQHALTELVAPVALAHLLRLRIDVEGGLRGRRGDQVDPLLVVAVERDGRILRFLLVHPRQAVEGSTQFPARPGPALADIARQHHVTHPEPLPVRIASHDEGRVLGAEEVRPARARLPGQGHVGGQSGPHPARVGDD